MRDPCPHCAHPLTACIAASEQMQVRHWWCQVCGYESRAIGRERMIAVEQVVSEAKYRGRP